MDLDSKHILKITPLFWSYLFTLFVSEKSFELAGFFYAEITTFFENLISSTKFSSVEFSTDHKIATLKMFFTHHFLNMEHFPPYVGNIGINTRTIHSNMMM